MSRAPGGPAERRRPRRRNWRQSPWTAVVVGGLALLVLVPQFVDFGSAAPPPGVDPAAERPVGDDRRSDADGSRSAAAPSRAADDAFRPVGADEVVPDPFRHDGLDLDDPPAAPGGGGAGAVPTAAGEPSVTLILRLGGSRVAVIGGRLVRPGDRIGAGTVVDVLADGVQVRGAGGALRTLPLAAPGADRSPTTPGAAPPEPARDAAPGVPAQLLQQQQLQPQLERLRDAAQDALRAADRASGPDRAATEVRR